MSKGTKTLFLTGATGVVGRALIDELADDHAMICLRHRRPIEDARVREAVGDVTQPDLGLSEADLAEAVERTDIVLHCGAATGWRTSRETFFSTNVEGTRRALEFAERAGALFYYVSTAFVEHRDQDDGERENGPMAYVASKDAAEEVVRDSSVPHVILRPSIFVGDSSDGRIAAFQGIHQVSGAILKDALPVLPADPANLIDYIPQDVAAKAIRRVIELGAREGEYWLTAGADAATLGDMVRVTLEVADALGISTHPPRLLPASTVDWVLIPVLVEVLTPALRRHFRMQLDLMHLFQQGGALPSSLRELGIEVTRESQVEAFRKSNEYWALKNGLGDAARVGQAA